MIRKGRAVDAKGRAAYLSNTERYRFPISFTTGGHNPMSCRKGWSGFVSVSGSPRYEGPSQYARHRPGGVAADGFLRQLADGSGSPGSTPGSGPRRKSLIGDPVQSQAVAGSRTWVMRKLLPDGSRNPESIPYGRSSGASVNSTPRSLSSS